MKQKKIIIIIIVNSLPIPHINWGGGGNVPKFIGKLSSLGTARHAVLVMQENII